MDGRREVEDLVRQLEQLLVLLLLQLNELILLVPARTLAGPSARFWLIITNVERKIASSDTIIVSNPYG